MQEYTDALKALSTLVENLCSHPDDVKYTRVRLGNPAFKVSDLAAAVWVVLVVAAMIV